MGEAGNGDVVNDYIAGAIGGATGLVFGHPFDTTKVQLQTQQSGSRYKGTWDAIRSINRQGWTNGFFRGLGFPLFSYGVVNGVFFGVYGRTLSYLKGGKKGTPSLWDTFLAGCVGGTAQLVVCCPVELVKVVLQSQIPHEKNNRGTYFKGPRQCLNWVLRTQGVRGLYSGLTALAYRDVPTFGVYIVVYERLSQVIQRSPYSDKQGSLAAILAGGAAGVTAWGICMPFDCIKSRMQADQEGRYRDLRDCARQMYRERGFRTFFDGLAVNSIRAFFVNAITFLVYSHVLREMNNYSRQAEAQAV